MGAGHIVKGAKYFSDGYEQVSFAWGGEEKRMEVSRLAHDELEKYPVGAQITVYYNQKRPQEHLLKSDVSKYIFLFIFGLILAGVCVWVTVSWILSLV